MKPTAKEYDKLNQQASKNTKSYITIPKAFVIGGLICMLGQAFIDLYQHFGVEKSVASTLCSVTLVFLASLLTGLNVYNKIAKHGGAGTLVPIPAFPTQLPARPWSLKARSVL